MRFLSVLDHLAATATMRLTAPLARQRIRAAGAVCDASVIPMGFSIVHCHPGSSMVIEDGVVLCSWSRWTALGVAHPVVLRTLRDGARLRVGRRTGISGGSFCAAVSVDIGEGCMIGADVTVCDTDFHALDPAVRRNGDRWDEIASRPVRIGNEVFIGARAVVLKGVDIGDGAVIGAGAVVTCNVGRGSIVAGNPATVVGSVSER